MKILLKLEDYYPIDVEFVKRKWAEIMNIPNNAWEDLGIDRSFELINDEDFPRTLRVFQLNTLPVVVIRILDSQKTGL